jgi:hypothetical protein
MLMDALYKITLHLVEVESSIQVVNALLITA